MPQPSVNDVHVDAILTNISVAYMQGAEGFVSTKVFPRVPVDKQSDKYYKYTKNDWFRDEAKRRPDATESAGSGYNLGTDSYSCDVYAFHKDIGQQVRANADNPLNLDREATAFVSNRLLMRQEIQWHTDYFATGVWATDNTTATDWSDYATSDPIENMEVGKEDILKVTGYLPNTLVLGYQVMRKLKHHPDLVDRLKYTTSNNSFTPSMVGNFFDIDRVLVSHGIKATNNEGATEAYDFITGKHALLMYVNPSPGLLAPSAGYVFTWKGVSEGFGTDVSISRIPIPLAKAERVEGQVAWDNKVVATDLGYFFSGIVA